MDSESAILSLAIDARVMFNVPSMLSPGVASPCLDFLGYWKASFINGRPLATAPRMPKNRIENCVRRDVNLFSAA